MSRGKHDDPAAAGIAQTERAFAQLRTVIATGASDGMASTAVACGFLEWAARFLGVGLAAADDEQTRDMLDRLFADFAVKTLQAQQARRDGLGQADWAQAPVASRRIH